MDFYACLKRDEKPFFKKDGHRFQDYGGKLHYGILLFTEKIGRRGNYWYLVDDSSEHAFPLHETEYVYNRREFWDSVKRVAMLSKSHWKILKEYIGREIALD